MHALQEMDSDMQHVECGMGLPLLCIGLSIRVTLS